MKQFMNAKDTLVTEAIGRHEVEAVTVARVDPAWRPIPGSAISFGVYGSAGRFSMVSNMNEGGVIFADSLNGQPFPIRSAEMVYELSYIAQLAPWWTLQPDMQYIVRPTGGGPHPVLLISAPYDKTTLGDTQQSKDRFITEVFDEVKDFPPVVDGKRTMPRR